MFQAKLFDVSKNQETVGVAYDAPALYDHFRMTSLENDYIITAPVDYFHIEMDGDKKLYVFRCGTSVYKLEPLFME